MQPDFQFTPVVEQSYDKKDPSEYLPWKRCTQTPHRPGKLLIVRPLKMIADFRPLSEEQKVRKAQAEAQGKEFWRGDLCVADIACLDPIEPAYTDLGEALRGFDAGHQWRNETIMLGYLNAAFKDYIGNTLVGTVYPQKTQFPQPAIRWIDLAADETAVNRARQFLIAFPNFLIPVAAAITPMVQPEPSGQAYGHHPSPQGFAAPTAAPTQGNPYPQADPWAQGPAQPVSPASQGHPGQGMSTVDQLRLARDAQNAQGQPQHQDPPF